jgi:hypothetical protein
MASGSYLAALAARAAGVSPASPLLRPPRALWGEAPAETVPVLETQEHAVEPPGPIRPAEPQSREPLPSAPGSPVGVVGARDLAAPAAALPPAVPERWPELAKFASEVAAPAPSSDDGPSPSLPVPAAFPGAAAQTPNPTTRRHGPTAHQRAAGLLGEPPPAFGAPPERHERAQSDWPPAAGGAPLVPLVALPTTNRPARGLEPERPRAEPRSRPAAAHPEPQEAAIRIGTVEVVVSTPPPTPPPAPTVAVAPPYAAGRLARGYSSSLGLGQT